MLCSALGRHRFFFGFAVDVAGLLVKMFGAEVLGFSELMVFEMLIFDTDTLFVFGMETRERLLAGFLAAPATVAVVVVLLVSVVLGVFPGVMTELTTDLTALVEMLSTFAEG